MKNIALLRSVQEIIRATPENCDMQNYVCGTVGCIAGHTVMLRYPDAVFHDGMNKGSFVVIDGKEQQTFEVAQELYGLDWDAARVLFGWSGGWSAGLGQAGTQKYAEGVASYIDQFITDQAETEAEVVPGDRIELPTRRPSTVRSTD